MGRLWDLRVADKSETLWGHVFFLKGGLQWKEMYLTDASEMVFFFPTGCSKSSSCDTSSVEPPLIALVLEVITRSLFTIYNLMRNLWSLIKYVVDVGIGNQWTIHIPAYKTSRKPQCRWTDG